jgi:ketosteroid isomerase-like protein
MNGDSSSSAPSRGILPTVIDQLRAAAEALNHGDPAPFASLFADDAEWRGVARGHLWWKHTPS